MPSPAEVLWTPASARRDPRVTPEAAAAVRDWESQVLSMMWQEGGILDHWNRELKLIDPFLRLMQAMPMAYTPGVRPGYYHLVRLRDEAVSSMLWVQPLTGPAGEFVEPTSQMLDILRSHDLQSVAAARARHEADQRAEESKLRAEQRDKEDRIDEMTERFKAATRAHVSMTDVNWTQAANPTARRGKKRA